MFYFIFKIVYCVYSLESPHWGDSNENKQHMFMLKKNLKCPYKASWSGAITSPHWFELPLSRTIFLLPKVFEPLKLYCIRGVWLPFFWIFVGSSPSWCPCLSRFLRHRGWGCSVGGGEGTFARGLIRRHLLPDVCSCFCWECVSECGSERADRCPPRPAQHMFL